MNHILIIENSFFYFVLGIVFHGWVSIMWHSDTCIFWTINMLWLYHLQVTQKWNNNHLNESQMIKTELNTSIAKDDSSRVILWRNNKGGSGWGWYDSIARITDEVSHKFLNSSLALVYVCCGFTGVAFYKLWLTNVLCASHCHYNKGMYMIEFIGSKMCFTILLQNL